MIYDGSQVFKIVHIREQKRPYVSKSFIGLGKLSRFDLVWFWFLHYTTIVVNALDSEEWGPNSKCYIACEHVVHVNKFLVEELGVSGNMFSTIHMLGSSESFLVNESKTHYTLADAIVESGSTLKANDLEIWKTIVPKGGLKIGLYLNKMNLPK